VFVWVCVFGILMCLCGLRSCTTLIKGVAQPIRDRGGPDVELTDLEILVLCAIYRRVGFATGRKPANITFQTIYKQLRHLGLSKRDVREALEALMDKGLARPYGKRPGKKGTITLTRQGAILASQICAARWDEIRDRLKRS